MRLFVFFIAGVGAAAGLTAGISSVLGVFGYTSTQAFFIGAGASMLIVGFAGVLTFILFPTDILQAPERASREQSSADRASLPPPSVELSGFRFEGLSYKDAINEQDEVQYIELQQNQGSKVAYINIETAPVRDETLRRKKSIELPREGYRYPEHSSSYAIPNTKRFTPGPSLFDPSSLQGLSTKELADELDNYGSQLVRLIQTTKSRILDIENATHQHLHLFDSAFSKRLMNARRIVDSLESRLERLTRLMTEPNEEKLYRARDILCSPLEMPRDAMTSLVSADTISPIPASEVQEELESILSTNERAVKDSGVRLRA